jgi:cell division transport system ATP-binding protein
MIQMFHVEKAYAKDSAALVDINLNIDKGEFVFLTGPSGAGKTTLLKLIFAGEFATRGQILIGGRNIARIRASSIPYLRRNVGVVFQDFKLLPSRTVFQNVAFALEVIGERQSEIKRKVFAVLKQLGLQHKLHQTPPRLSGGEQQRVAIARAIVNDPAILLADEPTGNLDPEMALDIMQILNDINARGTTVVVATHDVSILSRFHYRCLHLVRGRLVSEASGNPYSSDPAIQARLSGDSRDGTFRSR